MSSFCVRQSKKKKERRNNHYASQKEQKKKGPKREFLARLDFLVTFLAMKKVTDLCLFRIHLNILLLIGSMLKTRIQSDEIHAGRLYLLITLNLPIIQGRLKKKQERCLDIDSYMSKIYF